MNKYEEKLLGSNNPHWILSYITKNYKTMLKDSPIKVFIKTIQDSNSRSCKNELNRFLEANEALR